MSLLGCCGLISKINDHLFLSGASVLRPDRLRRNGITTIVNATVEEPSMYVNGIDCLKIRVEDHPHELLGAYFDIVADKIKMTKDKGGKTLVHCIAGVSRSPSLCIAYLMKYEHLSLRQAYRTVKSCRPIVRPNLGFWKQLIDYERKVTGKNTVRMVPISNDSVTYIPEVYIEERLYSQQQKPHVRTLPQSSYSSQPAHNLNNKLQLLHYNFMTKRHSDNNGVLQKPLFRKQHPSLEPAVTYGALDRLSYCSPANNHRAPSLTTIALMTSPMKFRVKAGLLESVFGSRNSNESSGFPLLF